MYPVRTCVGCRQRDLSKNLHRVVRIKDEFLVSDSSSGRGAWVHSSCIEKAIERKGFQRVLGEANLAKLQNQPEKQAEKHAGNQMSTSK